MLKLIDLARVAEVARQRKILTVCDNTFMTPFFQKPLELGIDVVVHSPPSISTGTATAWWICRTSDQALAERIYFLQNAVGGVPSPMDHFSSCVASDVARADGASRPERVQGR